MGGNLDTATDEHTTVAGELSNAQDEVARLTNLKAVHLEDQENAQDAFNNAEAALADAESWLSDETVRIDGERATLLEIRDLLDTLLPGSSNACTDAGDFAVGDGSGGTEQFLGWVSSIQECLDMIADANVPNGNGITVHPGSLMEKTVVVTLKLALLDTMGMVDGGHVHLILILMLDLGPSSWHS